MLQGVSLPLAAGTERGLTGEPAGAAAAHRPEPAAPPGPAAGAQASRAQGQGSCRGVTSLTSPGHLAPASQPPVQGLGVEVRMAPAHVHPGPGKGSGPKPEGARRWETLPGTGSSSQQPRRFGGRTGPSSQGFCPSRLRPLSLQGHWLPLTLPPAEEQGQSWWAGGRLRRGWDLGCTPAPHVQTLWPPEDPPAALTQHRCSQPLGVSEACPGAKGDLAQCPLGQGQTLGRRGPLLGPLVQPLLPAGGQKPGTSEKVPGPSEQQGGLSRAGWGLGSAPAQEMPAW